MQLKVLVGEAPSKTATHGRVRCLCAISIPLPVNNSRYLWISILVGLMTRATTIAATMFEGRNQDVN